MGNNDNLEMYLRIIALLYADDTVIVSSRDKDLQNAIDDFNNYCQEWKLKVNISKTKVVIFGARNTDQFRFILVFFFFFFFFFLEGGWVGGG